MKKLASLVLVFIMLCLTLLTGCKGEKFIGVYSFRMGKLEGKHFSITMELTNEEYADNGEVLGKKFIMTLDFLSMMDSGDSSSDLPIEEDTYDFAKDGISLTGYYKLGEEEDKGTRLLLGVSLKLLFEEVDALVVEAIGLSIMDFMEEDFSIEDINIENEFIELLVYAHVDDKQVTMVIPVSKDDLIFQLYWYGYDVQLESESALEVEKHAPGTHPTAEDIMKINETYPETHKIALKDEDGVDLKDESGNVIYEPIYYRDFYTIDLALLKE